MSPGCCSAWARADAWRFPLSLVSRLEEFPEAKLERYAGCEVIQYRDQIMPLVRLSEALGYAGSVDGDLLQVVVYSANGRSVGLVVDEILDIAEQAVEVQAMQQAKMLKGAAVIQQRVTDLLDVPALLAGAEAGGTGRTAGMNKRRQLARSSCRTSTSASRWKRCRRSSAIRR